MNGGPHDTAARRGGLIRPWAPPSRSPPMPPVSRRALPAGRVLVVGFICFFLWTFLNADALQRSAASSSLGTRRTLALGVTKPVRRVSALLSLDRPRHLLDRVAGRGAVGSTATRIALPAPPAAPGAGPPPLARLRRPTSTDPLRLFIGGDSIAEAFGNALVRAASGTGVITPHLDYQPSTGLSRPDYHDWPAQLAGEVMTGDQEVFVLVFGANDGQGFVVSGDVYDFGTDRWKDEYRRRVAATMDLLNAAGKPVVWVGQPVMRDAEFSARIDVMNRIYKDEASRRPGGVVFVDSRRLFSDQNGNYAAYLPDTTGQPELMRQSDGIHLTRAGGDRLAAAALHEITSRWPPASATATDTVITSSG